MLGWIPCWDPVRVFSEVSENKEDLKRSFHEIFEFLFFGVINLIPSDVLILKALQIRKKLKILSDSTLAETYFFVNKVLALTRRVNSSNNFFLLSAVPDSA